MDLKKERPVMNFKFTFEKEISYRRKKCCPKIWFQMRNSNDLFKVELCRVTSTHCSRNSEEGKVN